MTSPGPADFVLLNPDLSTGNLPLPRGVDMTSPDPDDVTRGATRSWNVFIERRLPLDISASIGYVGTRTDGQYATRNLNYAESGGNANRQLFAWAGTATINVLASSSKTRYHALRVAVNRPYKNGLLPKGAYTLSKAMNEGDDDGAGYTWPMPSQFHRNFALAGFDRPHMLQMGFVYELPFARGSSHPVALISRTGSSTALRRGCRERHSPSAVTTACCSSRAVPRRSTRRELRRQASVRLAPTNSGTTGRSSPQQGNAWGNTGRNAFRGPSNWNLDASVFRTISFGHYRMEIRAESQNVLTHAQFGNPVTGFTDLNFMRIRSLARAPRTVQLGVRMVF